jgi:hypothetical protein
MQNTHIADHEVCSQTGVDEARQSFQERDESARTSVSGADSVEQHANFGYRISRRFQ